MEVQIYRDTRNYSPKIVLGMTGRQLICGAVGLVVGGGGYALFWWAGLQGVGDWWLCVVGALTALVGWAKPKGLSIEAYGAYVVAHERQSAHVTYRQAVIPRTMGTREAGTKKGMISEAGR